MEPYAHLPSIQRRIVEFMMNQPQQSEGIHVAAVARHIGGDAHAIRYVVVSSVFERFLRCIHLQ